MSFIVVLLLTAISLPGWMNDWRPAWVAMMLMYWCITLPERVGIGIAWTLGLLMDAHTGALLGQNALGLSVVAYLTLWLHKQIRVYPALQQSLFVCVYLLLLQFLTMWIRGIVGVPPQHWTFWAPVASSTLLWPVLFHIMGRIRRRYNIF